MNSASRRLGGLTAACTGFAVLAALALVGGCQGAAPAAAPDARLVHGDVPPPAGSLPEVTVTLKPTTRAGAELAGYAWYVTSIRDPVRGSYMAAVERRSLTRLWFDVSDEGEQRASIALLLRDGRPTDLILSIEHGRFVCADGGRDHVCALRVTIDNSAPRVVRFSAPRHRPATSLHLVGGDDARRLLAAIANAKRLRIQPSFREEGSPEIEFALNGLSPAIARVMKHSVAAMARVTSGSPGA